MREHEKALRILVHHLNDFASAEEYCNQMSSNLSMSGKKEKEKLLFNLLSVLLDADTTNRLVFYVIKTLKLGYFGVIRD